MRDSQFSHLCTALLGTASMLRFIGYDMATLIVESVLHSAYQRDNETIVNHAGYYGQAVKEVVGCVSTLFIPSILNYMHAKWAMVLGATLFATYVASFLYIHNILYFFANALLGFAYSINATAFSTYQTEFSTKQNLARNAARIWGIADIRHLPFPFPPHLQISLIIGGIIYIVVSSTSNALALEGHRYYSAEETRLMYTVFTSVSFASLLVYLALPTRQLPDSVAALYPRQKLGIREQGAAVVSMLIHPSLLLLIPRSIHYGFFLSFMMNVYPTTLQFSTILASRYPFLAAYYGMSKGLGCILGMFGTGYLNKRIKDYALGPLQAITLLLQLLVFSMVLASTPQWSATRPTTEEGLLFAPSLLWALSIGVLLGLVDSFQNTSTMVVCSRILPERMAHVHSARRFYAGLASAGIFFASPLLSISTHFFLLVSTAVAGSIGFMIIVRSLRKTAEGTKASVESTTSSTA